MLVSLIFRSAVILTVQIYFFILIKGELMEIMSFPHLESEDITDFLIVPTFQPNNRMKGISSKSFHTPHAMPALLFVTKCTSDKLYGNDGKVTGRCHDNVPALNMGKMLKGSNQLRTISCATGKLASPIPALILRVFCLDLPSLRNLSLHRQSLPLPLWFQ